MKRRVGIALLLVCLALAGVVAWVLVPPRSEVDLGALGVVVLQSDDWGLEGWFPDGAAATALADLVQPLPPHLQAYSRGGLETADDVRAIADLLASRQDADGLPFVLQANHIVAAPNVSAESADDAPFGWPLHSSGESTGRYARPGLDEAVDTAMARGVWWPELHGLTHFDLLAYARARAARDPIALRAREHDTLAHEGWYRRSELDGEDAQAALRIAQEASTRFARRFGRPPLSVIAPDYRWGPEDERAWDAVGIEVVQAKREQVDRRLRPYTFRGRLTKWLRQRWEARTSPLHYLERAAELEPYGDPDPGAAQGSDQAVAAVRAAWAKGQPGVLSVHRIQLVSFDDAFAQAGRAQLLQCIDALSADRPVRCLVDTEVAQLQRRGWSSLERGPWIIVRNHTRGAIELEVGSQDERRSFAPGTHLILREPRDAVGSHP